MRFGGPKDTTDDLIMAHEVFEEVPTPRALANPRALSRPRPGVPLRIGPYQINRSYHSGMGDGVFLAFKTSAHGLATQTIIKWARRGRPEYEAKRQALLDEARALSLLQHPGIVRFLDSDEDESGTYIALEYVQGTDLRAVLERLGKDSLRAPTSLSCFIAHNVLRALDYAHRAVDESGVPLEIVHRDVTPSNILISYEGHLKLTDFGVVRMRNRKQSETMPGLVKGKFHYMAPEYISGSSPSPRSDLYAVGVTLFEFLTGTRAFPKTGQRRLFEAILEDGLNLEALRANRVPETLIDIIARATHMEAQKRFPSAGKMADELEAWLAREGTYVSATSLTILMRRLGMSMSERSQGVVSS